MQQSSSRLLLAAILTLASFGVAGLGCAPLRHDIARAMLHDVGRSQTDDVGQSAQNYAARLNNALAQQTQAMYTNTKPRSTEVVPQVLWLDQPAPPSRVVSRQAVQRQAVVPSPPLMHIDANPQPVLDVSEVSSRQDQSQHSEIPDLQSLPLDRQVLWNRLLNTIRSSDDQPVDKALAATALSLIHPDRRLDHTDLLSLTPGQRKRVEQYHKVVVALAKDLPLGTNPFDADALGDRVRNMFDQSPIAIRHIELCRRVRGYGVYEPFETDVFLAGRKQPMIIYAELSNFTPVKSDDGRYEVHLSQDVVLYNEPDGLAVWRQPKVDIVDESRNRRRDFFVVQMIKLPARLNVGKYVLKVRINDVNGGSLDEAAIPIQFVADQSLVGGQVR